MLAWRRADVAALNRIAREHRIVDGHVETAAVRVEGGKEFAVGDLVVALSPDPDKRYSTSQRGEVTAINPIGPSVTIRFDDADESVVLRGDALAADHLDHAYAVTVHRAQGATVDRTHLYADGGGAELAYVACSRARDTTTIHCVADDLDQATEDLERDWTSERRQRWTLDTDDPAAPGQRTRPTLRPRTEIGLRLGRLRAERAAVLATIPIDPHAELAALRHRRQQLAEQLRDLGKGTGGFTGTKIGDTARCQADALREYETAREQARTAPRRHARRTEAALDEKHDVLRFAQRRWAVLVRPVEQQLLGELEQVEHELIDLEAREITRATWQLRHPEAMQRLAVLSHEIAALEARAGIASTDLAFSRPPPDRSIGGLSR